MSRGSTLRRSMLGRDPVSLGARSVDVHGRARSSMPLRRQMRRVREIRVRAEARDAKRRLVEEMTEKPRDERAASSAACRATRPTRIGGERRERAATAKPATRHEAAKPKAARRPRSRRPRPKPKAARRPPRAASRDAAHGPRPVRAGAPALAESTRRAPAPPSRAPESPDAPPQRHRARHHRHPGGRRAGADRPHRRRPGAQARGRPAPAGPRPAR